MWHRGNDKKEETTEPSHLLRNTIVVDKQFFSGLGRPSHLELFKALNGGELLLPKVPGYPKVVRFVFWWSQAGLLLLSFSHDSFMIGRCVVCRDKRHNFDDRHCA